MAKKLSLVFGVVFLVVGLLGFVSNPIVGEGAMFHTDGLHNVVHLLFGLMLLYGGTKGGANASMILKVSGVIYLVLAVLGFLMGGDSLLGLVAINSADNWLHLVLGLGLLYAGIAKGGSSMSMGGSSM